MSHLDPVVQIGNWYYQVIYGQLWPVDATMRAESMIRLEPRLHSLLNYFLLHPNILLAKDTLIEKVWPADEGTDAAVMRAVGALRKVLGDDVRAPVYIETSSKKGYRWLAEITPARLQDIGLISATDASDAADNNNTGLIVKPRKAWRFIAATAAALIVGGASLAYVLATYTAAPLLKLPDTITPVSALSGQEYWPVLYPDQSHVLYQHKAIGADTLNWSVQNLADLRVEHLAQQYRRLSQALWPDSKHIVFRAQGETQGCYFYRQALIPVIEPPQQLWPCRQVMPQGAALWQDSLLWLDRDSTTGQLQLMRGRWGEAAEQLLTLRGNWRDITHLLLREDTLYLVAEETVNQSALLQLKLPDGLPHVLMRLPYVVTQFSWWDNKQLLLSGEQQELQIVDLKSKNMQSLGRLTRDLTQASRHPGQVLATQFLDYTTDILRVVNDTTHAGIRLVPWHMSNRNERLPAISERGQVAYVSERAGHNQIWLAQGRDSRQLSHLTEQQYVQQLFWHRQQLLVLINAMLYRLDADSGVLTPYPQAPDTAVGRYASCDNVLYWTTLTDNGWQLMAESSNTALLEGVTDVRCGPQQALVVQFADSTALALLTPTQQLLTLPVYIDWHSSSAEQWFSDDSGIYWLGDNNTIYRFDWLAQQTMPLLSAAPEMLLAIYSNGNGPGYIVRQRPYDTDIVWLQNRR
ncbi:winged helix-turn-helix domain-containing protein [Rheinheimera sp. NSM]|uniref:winged helix-turn-helix domain-containing protein n=1 Tax=Rheinheimera sp. NSM TaxID=3457884 RepID=UPI004036FD74